MADDTIKHERHYILIADDDESIRKSLSMVLTKKGFDVVQAGTGNEAISLAKKHNVNIGILDIRMPDTEGFDLFDPLKSIHPDIGLILVTGYASVETAKQALKRGATAYITKPLDIDELLKVIQDITDKQRLEKEKLKIEQELIYERNLFNTFLENIPDAVYFKDKEARFVRVSKSLTELFETPYENIIGKTDQDFFTKELAAEKMNRDLTVIEAGIPFINIEEKVQTLGGKKRWASTSKLPWKNTAGEVIGLFGISRDISVLKEAQATLEKTLNDLKESNKELSVLLEVSSSLLKYRSFNDAARMLFDSCCEVTGATSGYVALLNDEKNLNEVLFLEAGGKPCTVDPSLPMPVRGLRAEAYKSGQTVYDNNFMNGPWVKYIPEGHLNLENVLFAPLNIDEKTVGVIGLANKPGGFNEHDVHIATAFGELAAISLKNCRNMDALSESEHQFRELFNNMNNGVAVYQVVENGNDFLFKDINKAGERISNVKRDQIVNKSISEVFPSVKQFGLYGILQKVYKTGQPVHLPVKEYIDKRISQWVENYVYKLPSGEVIAVYDDVSDRKKAEDALIESNRQLKLALSSSNIGPWDWNLVTNQVYFSPEWKRQIGFEDDELPNTYEEWESRIHPDDHGRIIKILNEYLDGKRDEYAVEFRLLHKDNSYRWIFTRAEMLRDTEGKPLRMIGCHVDITAQKESEQEILKREERFRNIFDNAAVSIWEQDWSGVYQAIEDLKKSGVTDFSRYLKDHPETIEKALRTTKKLDVNDMTLKIYGAKTKDELLVPYGEHFVPEVLEWFREFMVAIAEGKSYFQKESVNKTVDGRLIDVVIGVNIPGDKEQFRRILLTVNDITERKLMEEKIRESEETFRTISSSAQDAIIMIDDKGNVSFWNEAAERIFGYTREEIEGRDLHKIVVPQRYHEAHKKGFNNFHKSGTGNAIGKIMELSALRKNGEEFPVDLSLSSVKVKGKWNSIGIVRDISDRKHQEDLQKAYQRVRESIWKMIKSEDIDTVAVTFRDALKDIGIQFKYFGINIIETSGKTPQVYAYEYSEKERNISKPGLDNVRVLMKIWKDGVPVYRKDIQKNDELGEKKDIESNFGNTTIRSILDVPFSHGTVAINSTKPDAFSKVDIESLVDMAQVLSEGFKRLEDLQNIEQYTKNLERMVEERTKDLNRALQDTEHARDNIDNILKAVADGLIVTDKYNRVVLMNKVAEDMLNIRLSEVINRPIDFAIEEKTLREKLINTFNKKKTNYQFDFRLQGNDPKHPVILRARTSIIYDKYGEKNGIVTSFTDVTHEREVDRMKTEFISTAAHELRTPLTSIVGFSKILVTRNDITEEERNRFLNYINNQGLKLSRIVSDILDISRIESGKGFELNLEPCNLGKIIEQVLPYYQELSSIHTFDLTIPEEPVILKLDSEKIEQVLKNILSNAVKYSPDGGIIHVSLQLADSTCKVSIKDEGIGMTAEQIAKVFDKFYRVNATNSAPDGTGLGMVIVKYIVEAHGGKIHVDSEYGVGTTVSFTLPANRKNTQKNRNVKD